MANGHTPFQNEVEVDQVYTTLADQLLFGNKGKEHYNMMYRSGDGVAGLVFSLRIQMDYFDYHPNDGNRKMGYGENSKDRFVHILVYGQHRTYAVYSKKFQWQEIPLEDWKFLTCHDAQWRYSIQSYIKDSISACRAETVDHVPEKVLEKFGDHKLVHCLLSFGLVSGPMFEWVRADDDFRENGDHPHDRQLVMLRSFEDRGDPKNIMPPWDENTTMDDDMIEDQLEKLSSKLEEEKDENKKKAIANTLDDLQNIIENRQKYRNEIGYPRDNG